MSTKQQPPSSCPAHADVQSGSHVSGCPVAHGGELNPLTNEEKPVYFGAAHQHGQLSAARSDAPSTVEGLSTIAVSSNIPKGGTENADEKWIYPSPQRFYNAMKKKGWEPQAGEMPYVVSIHNTINERTWREVLEYEQLHADECATPRLLRFRGRPKDFSPKARLMNWIGGYKLPFDRHDWVVDRCGRQVEYVIDFYEGRRVPGLPAAVWLDVRPKLQNGPQAALDRLHMYARRTWWSHSSSSSTSSSSSSPSPPAAVASPAAASPASSASAAASRSPSAAAASAQEQQQQHRQ